MTLANNSHAETVSPLHSRPTARRRAPLRRFAPIRTVHSTGMCLPELPRDRLWTTQDGGISCRIVQVDVPVDEPRRRGRGREPP
ncbi:hypothetical protein GCM10020295_11960 [Streptomyces cinereospinus]